MLRVEDVSVRFGQKLALDRVSLDAGSDETVALLGPSGSGKSTLLRAIAGLESIETGTISFSGENLRSVPTHLRRFGFMFQGYALFPHLSVRDNVAFGLRMQGGDESLAEEALDMVGLTGFAGRSVDRLSGGEQQRVALARTLAPDPRLVMLDEPVGALDRQLRRRLIEEMRDLLAGRCVLYVTHDHDEARSISDRIALLNEGRIIQTGTYDELARHPADGWVEQFLGA